MRSLAFAITVTAPLLAGSLAHAGDASWLLCKGVAEHDGAKMYVAASLVEHRAADGENRDLAVTLLKGANSASGNLLGKKVGDFAGKSTPLALTGHGKTVWKGKVVLANDFTTFAMDGSFDISFGTDRKAKLAPFTAKLTCETLDDLAIGH
jgi:hypothetical protein